MSDLVKRLRQGGADICADGPMWPGDDMLAAAARIEALEAENARLREALAIVSSCLDTFNAAQSNSSIVLNGAAAAARAALEVNS